MLSIFREGFIKDLLVWFLLSILLASLCAAGAGMVADRYFSRTVEGLIGDVGEYDLLFQVRTDLKEVAVSRLRQIIQEKAPGSTLKIGVSVAGKTAVFVGLAPKYRVKEVYTNLDYYFRDIPGSGNFSLMTEPRVTLSALPRGVLDLFIREAERIAGVRFAFQDGSNIAVLLEKEANIKKVTKALGGLLESYRLLEVRFPAGYNGENAVEIGRNLAHLLAGKGGISLIRDVTPGQSSDDQQALIITMAEMKRFLLSYAGRVKVIPTAGALLNPGDLLAIGAGGERSLEKGELVKSGDVIVKITSPEQDGAMQGLIIQGDSSALSEPSARLLVEDKKVGEVVANIIIDSPKQRLDAVLDESINLLGQVGSFQDLPFQARQVLTAAETIQAALESINGTGAETADLQKMRRLSALLEGTGAELQKMADQLARLRWVENQLEKAIGGLEGIQTITRLGFIPQNVGYYGDLGQKVGRVDQEIERLLGELRSKAKALDDFLNRLNPLVRTLLEWKAKTTKLANQLAKVESLIGGQGSSFETITELTGLTTDSLRQFEELDFSALRQGLDPLEADLGALEEANLMMIIDELKMIKSSLPKLKDEEIGKTISLLDNYLGGEVTPGEKVQLFVNAGYKKEEVTQMVAEFFASDQVRIQALPPGVLQPDVRNEVSRLLGEVRGVIAAIAVIIMGILAFLQDQAPILAIFCHLDLIAPYRENVSALRKKEFRLAAYRGLLPWIYAAGLGAVWLWATIKLSGAHIPYFTSQYFLVVGALIGMIFYWKAERFHHLNMEEVVAGYALGFSFTTVMREIIIPAGRPGIMQMLNRRKMVMK